jgi:hypothetical protein
MKKIEPKKLIALMEAIYYQPCAQIVHFAQSDLSLLSALADYCDTKEFGYQLNTPDQSFFEEAKQLLSPLSSAKLFKMPITRPKFRIAGKEYDYLILTLPIDGSNRLSFLKKAHEILRNHGKIVIFLPKSEAATQQHWITDLETSLYVATSVIDDMFANHIVILSNKMHGWK